MMKQLFTTITLACLMMVGLTAQAQLTLYLELDGENPDPFNDRTGKNTVQQIGSPSAANGELGFPTGMDYLKIDPFDLAFDINGDWRVEFDILVNAQTDTIFPIDFRSNSSVGHMHVGYDVNSGIYFSDREVNGIYGNIVADSMPLTDGVWASVIVEKIGANFTIKRDGNVTATATEASALSEVNTTTIGYSEDFRYAHGPFYMDNVKVYGGSGGTSSVQEWAATAGPALQVYPNPVLPGRSIYISSKERITAVQLFDLTGQLVYTSTLNGQRLQLPQLASGMYLLSLEDVTGKKMVRKLTVGE